MLLLVQVSVVAQLGCFAICQAMPQSNYHLVFVFRFKIYFTSDHLAVWSVSHATFEGMTTVWQCSSFDGFIVCMYLCVCVGTPQAKSKKKDKKKKKSVDKKYLG